MAALITFRHQTAGIDDKFTKCVQRMCTTIAFKYRISTSILEGGKT